MTTDTREIETPILYDDVQRILDDESAWIARPSDVVTTRIAIAAYMKAEAALAAARKREEEALMAVVAAMSEALAPFAAYADKDRALSDRPSNMGMQVTTGALYMVPQITMGDCYRARQALSLAQLDGGANGG